MFIIFVIRILKSDGSVRSSLPGIANCGILGLLRSSGGGDANNKSPVSDESPSSSIHTDQVSSEWQDLNNDSGTIPLLAAECSLVLNPDVAADLQGVQLPAALVVVGNHLEVSLGQAVLPLLTLQDELPVHLVEGFVGWEGVL